MKRFVSITRKVTSIILSSLSIGIGAVVVYFAYGQNATVQNAARVNLQQQAEVLHQSIKNAMLPGEAPLVVSLFNDIHTISPSFDIRLYRENGSVAFSDNATLDVVNTNLGQVTFRPKTVFVEGEPINASDLLFKTAVMDKQTVSFQHTGGQKTYRTIYKPLLNLPKCTPCHGSDHTLRGVIAIQSDMTATIRQARNNIIVALVIFIGAVLGLFIALSSFLRRTILTPVRLIGHVCAAVTAGNFHEKVRIAAQDEIGNLGQTINTMVDGLYERYELSKYVSAATIKAIQQSEHGARAAITLFFSDIRGFTSFSEKHPPETVIQYLNTILNVQTDIIHQYGGDIDKYVGDEIVALFIGEHKEFRACQAALAIQRHMLQQQAELAGLAVGIGINTGDVILGMIGSEKRADYTVIGDHVNLASRLCSKAKSGAILLSEATYQPIHAQISVAGPFAMTVKGKAHEQKVYALTALRSDA